ncbi:MAG: 50S ribosomal protein L28 [Malacoplasma sp.]|nr:50S ribosomal protein L28 [Mycoplasmataceae bacterium]MDD7685637.1 50S ribosomal protein L28 [Mycoplasmataceae bacterium]MDY2887524.1 50S ribosomal protein L28 [Malacoplasma sp.]
MSRRDQLTNRGQMTGNSRSFAMNHSRRTWKVNLQPANIKTGKNTSTRVMVSTKTLKTLKRDNKLA